MSNVLGSFAPELTKELRDRLEVPRATPVVARAGERSSHNVALPNGCGPVYNEEAFRYFLQVERKRATRSNSRFLVLLVDLTCDAQQNAHFDTATATNLFAAMLPCLRETDFIGWYRQGRVASAVLTQVGEAPGIEVSKLVADRVRDALAQSLPQTIADRLQVRAYQVPSTTLARS